MNKGNYIVIQDWMINDLKLKNNELLVYATIYGFTQDGMNSYTPTLKELADYLNIHKDTVRVIITNLENKNLIYKQTFRDNSGHLYCEYRANTQTGYRDEKADTENPHWGKKPNSKNPYEPDTENPHNINKEYINKEKEKDNNNLLSKKKVEENSEDEPKIKRFVKPTIEEIAEYCKARKNNIDAESFYYHYEAKGWKIGKNPIKNWKACVITWEKNNNCSAGRRIPESIRKFNEVDRPYDAKKEESVLLSYEDILNYKM